jgi:hypothetical protein
MTDCNCNYSDCEHSRGIAFDPDDPTWDGTPQGEVLSWDSPDQLPIRTRHIALAAFWLALASIALAIFR